MRQLRQIRERGRTEIDQMLALQIATGALPRHRGHALRPVLGQDRRVARLEFPLMLCAESARDDPHTVSIQIQRAG